MGTKLDGEKANFEDLVSVPVLTNTKPVGAGDELLIYVPKDTKEELKLEPSAKKPSGKAKK